jgi:hypothetical protein
LIIGKLERCPHCGRIAIVPRANHAMLAAAEAHYREDQVRGQREVTREAVDYKERLEESRYET